MGEIREDDEDATRDWQSMVDLGEYFPGTTISELSDRLRAAGPPPVPLRGTPLIIDTDIGGDPDDAVAVAAAALAVPELSLVMTCDEMQGQRARFARHLLDLMGRYDVPVVAGVEGGSARYYVVEDLTPDDVPEQDRDIAAAVIDLASRSDGPIRWVGMGPMSNLARVLRERPELAERFVVTQMGGAINYRDPNRAEHNVRLDVDAARRVIATAKEPYFVISDVTFTPELEIDAGSDIYQRLASAGEPWASLLVSHMDRWFATFHPGTIQHDALTLAAALELPFTEFDLEPVSLDEIGRMRRDPKGSQVFLADSTAYSAFMRWLTKILIEDRAA